jgi:hypothetical protein
MVLTPTRRPLTGRLIAKANCLYLRWVIRCAEHDMAQHKAEFEHASKHLPKQIAADRKHIEELTKRLVAENCNT